MTPDPLKFELFLSFSNVPRIDFCLFDIISSREFEPLVRFFLELSKNVFLGYGVLLKCAPFSSPILVFEDS